MRGRGADVSQITKDLDYMITTTYMIFGLLLFILSILMGLAIKNQWPWPLPWPAYAVWGIFWVRTLLLAVEFLETGTADSEAYFREVIYFSVALPSIIWGVEQGYRNAGKNKLEYKGDDFDKFVAEFGDVVKTTDKIVSNGVLIAEALSKVSQNGSGK